jgi:hypothetical protein
MSRLLAPFVAVLASSVVWACDGSGSGTGTVDPVVTQQDAPVATTSGDGSIPSSACWKYDSATISANDVNRWNNLSAEWDTSRAPPHKIDWFDDNQKSIKFLKNFEQLTPRMTASGLFTPTW